MGVLEELHEIYKNFSDPFLVSNDTELHFGDLSKADDIDLSSIAGGDVVALIGNYSPSSINTLLRLIDLKAIIVPLTRETLVNHNYYFAAAAVDVVIDNGGVKRIRKHQKEHPMLACVKDAGAAGLVLFSSGTTGRPKAILHDMEKFLIRFRTPRPTLKTLNFLLFDHIGGINTLLHTLFNRGVVVLAEERTPNSIINSIKKFGVELLPTTPTFLRMMLIGDYFINGPPPSLKMVTYGTERMDDVTLNRICEQCPGVDFRQTYGMSELGILRVKSQARNSLWIKVGGEGVETHIRDGVLQIKSENRMVGYLNAPSPFDAHGWHDTGDLVDVDGEWLRIIGRTNDTINIGGIKVLPEEIERAALLHPDVLHARAIGVENPITGQHIELFCEPRVDKALDRKLLKRHLQAHLEEQLVPQRIRIGNLSISHRFKKS